MRYCLFASEVEVGITLWHFQQTLVQSKADTKRARQKMVHFVRCGNGEVYIHVFFLFPRSTLASVLLARGHSVLMSGPPAMAMIWAWPPLPWRDELPPGNGYCGDTAAQSGRVGRNRTNAKTDMWAERQVTNSKSGETARVRCRQGGRTGTRRGEFYLFLFFFICLNGLRFTDGFADRQATDLPLIPRKLPLSTTFNQPEGAIR